MKESLRIDSKKQSQEEEDEYETSFGMGKVEKCYNIYNGYQDVYETY